MRTMVAIAMHFAVTADAWSAHALDEWNGLSVDLTLRYRSGLPSFVTIVGVVNASVSGDDRMIKIKKNKKNKNPNASRVLVAHYLFVVLLN